MIMGDGSNFLPFLTPRKFRNLRFRKFVASLCAGPAAMAARDSLL
jgi:putative intracellular protease/amidase